MKLRLKGNSIRLRVVRSELAKLQAGERIQETLTFPGNPSTTLEYILGVGPSDQPVQAAFSSQQIVVMISPDQLTSWSGEHQVGIYASLPVSKDLDLDLAIEKDFACLDLSDEENKDTFANPLAGKIC